MWDKKLCHLVWKISNHLQIWTRLSTYHHDPINSVLAFVSPGWQQCRRWMSLLLPSLLLQESFFKKPFFEGEIPSTERQIPLMMHFWYKVWTLSKTCIFVIYAFVMSGIGLGCLYPWQKCTNPAYLWICDMWFVHSYFFGNAPFIVL